MDQVLTLNSSHPYFECVHFRRNVLSFYHRLTALVLESSQAIACQALDTELLSSVVYSGSTHQVYLFHLCSSGSNQVSEAPY